MVRAEGIKFVRAVMFVRALTMIAKELKDEAFLINEQVKYLFSS